MVSGPRGQDTCPGPLSSGESKPPGGVPAVTRDTPRVPQGPADGRRGSRLGARITGSLLGPGHPSRLQASMWSPAMAVVEGGGAETTQWGVTGFGSIPGELSTNQKCLIPRGLAGHPAEHGGVYGSSA